MPHHAVRRLTYYLVAVVVVVLGVGVALVFYVDHEVRQSNQEWCDLLTTLDSPVPPDNQRGRDVAGKLHTLRINFGC